VKQRGEGEGDCKATYPGILWFAPFVEVPPAILPFLSITIIPATQIYISEKSSFLHRG